MAGRHPAQTQLVDANEILNVQQVRNEFWNLATLIPELAEDVALLWCARRRLIKNEMPCDLCHKLCTLNRYKQGLDGHRWSCRKCGTRKSVRHGSFFSRSHMTIKEIIILIYCWACDMPQQQMSREAGRVEKSIVADWCNFMREECATWLKTHATEIGGVDDDFNPIVVEISETNYFHRKYHRGQWQEEHRIFGGIERESGRCFLVEVPDKQAETLEHCIMQHILPGSHIISDDGAAYANIDRISHGIYSNTAILHQQNVLYPQDDKIHTKSIGKLWMRAKRKLKRKLRLNGALFNLYLQEFAYRNFMIEGDMFSNFIVTVADNYP